VTTAIVVTGAGGVGKTTVAAALAVRCSRAGQRTLVVTVDPARRLADALGLELGSEPRRVEGEPLLSAAMIDAVSSWQAVARRHADPAVASRLVDSEFFQAASGHFPASQSYAAAEEAATYLDAGLWDVVVVDTPPAAGGIDFFTAPSQMADLVGGTLLRLLTGGRLPGRRFLFNRGARPLLRLADQILGSDLLERVAQFLMDLRTTYDGVRRRAQEIESHFLKAFTIVVTTADPAPMTEALRFFRQLPEIASPPGLIVFNRSLPLRWVQAAPPPRTSRALAENLARWGAEAQRQADARAEFSAHYRTPLATIPWMPHAPTDVDALANLIEQADNWPAKLVDTPS
jgi:anion-transporting  ArsA/GET3 family ATPase